MIVIVYDGVLCPTSISCRDDLKEMGFTHDLLSCSIARHPDGLSTRSLLPRLRVCDLVHPILLGHLLKEDTE